jgi:hypothetical protein
VSLTTIDIVSENNRLPYADIAPSEYGAFRARLARQAVALREIIDGTAPVRGVIS